MVTGNLCNGNTQNGIYVYTDHISIVGNVCRYNGFNGISLYAADYDLIVNNYVYNSSYGNDNTYSGIFLEVYSTNNVINGNYVHDDNPSYQAKYGIAEEDANSDYNLIVGNHVSGQQTDGIVVNGANTISANNMDLVV